MSRKVKIVEVGIRDGLQNENKIFSVSDRWKMINGLTASGVQHIEVGAFVSPRWVPQMHGSLSLGKKAVSKNKRASKKINYSALVPNERGMQDAIKSGLKEISIFGACTESFSKKNINCSMNESFERFKKIVILAKKNKIKVRGYLSMAFGCAYEGRVSQAKVVQLVEKMLDLGVYEVSLGDTIGVATPKQVRGLLDKLNSKVAFTKLAMHFHDTRGTALANVLASLDQGIYAFDSSVGGLGGCPYAGGASSGNLATEDLVYMLHGMGFKTGINLTKLIATYGWIQKRLDHSLPSHVGRAGEPKTIGI